MGETRKYFAAAGLSGLLMGLAYPGWGFGSTWLTTSDLGWLAWIGLIPLLWSLEKLRSVRSDLVTRSDLTEKYAPKKHLFLLGFFAGLVYFLIVFRWLWSAYPLDTIGISGWLVSLLGIAAIYLVSSAGMAAFWGLLGLAFSVQRLAFSKESKNHSLPWTYYFLLTTPALFVLLEYARAWSFGFLWAGYGSLFGPHWTLGNLAYSLVNNPLALKLASFSGIYGITFLIVLANCLIFIILKTSTHAFATSPRTALIPRVVLVALILLVIMFGPKLIKPKVPQESVKKINFAIIQTAQQTRIDPSPQEKLASFKEQLELLNQVAKEHPESQLIVFPEASDFFTNLSLFLTPTQVQDYFSKLFREPRLIISGSRILDSVTGKAYSRVFSLDTHGDIIGFYDKRLVAPGGEFLPYPLKFLVSIFSKNTSSLFNQFRDLRPGQKEVSTVGFRYQFNVAPIICSEAVAPGLIKKTTQNSDVIVSMASYSAFHGNHTIADQMLAITRFRAVENRKPIITAANMGRSYVIDNRGNVVFLAQDAEPKILTGSMDIAQQQSWYNKGGDSPVLLGSLVLTVLAVSGQWLVFSKKTKSN